MFDPDCSPPPELLNEFYDKFHKDAFVRALFGAVELKKALQSLENAFSSFVFHSYVMDDNTKELKRREREVRFIHRFAKIIGGFGLGPALPNATTTRQLQRKLARAMRVMKVDLATLISDEYFMASIPFECNRGLRHIKDFIINDLDYFEQAEPAYPYSRVRDAENTQIRLLIDRLTDVCLRIYCFCDENILLQLTNYKKLPFENMPFVAGFEKKEIKQQIKLATERKIDAYNRRLPLEDSESVDLYGVWMPARTLDPPWW